MVKNRYFLIGGLMVIFVIVVVLTFFPNEEKKVKKQFHLLSKCVLKSPNESSFTLLQKMKEIGSLFDEHCELKVPDQSFSGNYAREEISTYVTNARSHFSQLDLKFYDFHVLFLEERIAKVTLTSRLTGKSTIGEQVDEVHELECILKKIGGKWLFSEIEAIEVLKK
jgi:hypothetical protein